MALQRDQPAVSAQTTEVTRHMSLGGGGRRHLLISGANPFPSRRDGGHRRASVTRR